MQIFKTKGIVLRTVNYGETTIIATLYTAKFGLQSYLLKGIRPKSNNTYKNKISYFHIGAILDLEAYHNEKKNLQFLKSYERGFIFSQLYSSIPTNTIAVFIIEIALKTLKPLADNQALYDCLEHYLQALETATPTDKANLPIEFLLAWIKLLGFEIQDNYSIDTAHLDLRGGKFTDFSTIEKHLVNEKTSHIVANFLSSTTDAAPIFLNSESRFQVIQTLIQYLEWHLEQAVQLKSLPILKEILA